MKDIKKFLPLLILFLVFEGVSAVIGISTAPNGDIWYESLIKSPLTPPDWVFGVMWPSLYFLMAISVWLIIGRKDEAGAMPALGLFGVHMILNWSWNFIFFEYHMIFEAFVLLGIILLMAAILTLWFFRIHKVAGLLLLPYIAWLSFAAYLSGTIWIQN